MTLCTVLQEKVGTTYNHPTTQYEQFIEQYYGRHKGSGKSKATVISDGQVILLDIRGVTLWGGRAGGSNLEEFLCTEDKILSLITSLDTSKSTGADSVSAKMLKSTRSSLRVSTNYLTSL